MKRLTVAPVFTSPLQRAFRTCGLAGFAAVAKHGDPKRGRIRRRAVPLRESTVEGRHTDSGANGSVFGTKRSAIR
jgi:hypothetical protein